MLAIRSAAATNLGLPVHDSSVQVGLALPLLEPGEEYTLHLSKRNDFVDQWLKIIMPELTEDRILTGKVAARRLLVPQQESGNPTPAQVGH